MDPKLTAAALSHRLAALEAIRASKLDDERKLEAMGCELHTHACALAGATLQFCDRPTCPGYTWATEGPGGHPHPCSGDLTEFFRPPRG